MKSIAPFPVVCLVLGAIGIAPTQGILDRGGFVTIVVPRSALRTSTLVGNGLGLTIELVRGTKGQAIPRGDEDWQGNGFPDLEEMSFERTTKKNGVTEIEFRGDKTIRSVKFRMSSDVKPEEMLRPFVLRGRTSDAEARAYLTEVYGRIAARVFTGSLSSVAEGERLALVKLASASGRGYGIDSERYKDKMYLAVDLFSDDTVYNSLRLNESQRLSEAMTKSLLTVLKAFAAPLRASAAIDGVKLKTSIRYADAARPYQPEGQDELSVYALSELIRKFNDADMTSQEFIDGCVVILNGNRVKVVLGGVAVPEGSSGKWLVGTR